MTNRNGRKGASFERVVADHLRDHWDDRIDRRVRTGAKDKGDVANFRVAGMRVVVEAKNVQRTDLAGWIREAKQEAENDGALVGLVVHKAKGKAAPAEQYATLTLGDLLLLLEVAGGKDQR